MKNLILFIASFYLLYACDNKPKEDSNSSKTVITNPHSATSSNNKVNKLPAIEWDKTKHDFGNVFANQPVKYAFKFKNVGETDLIIVDSRTSCGCTTPELPKKPIPPGETSQIIVQFKKSGSGSFSKQITLVANTIPKEHYLHITGKLIEEKN